jgi:hypothetical protein
MEKGHIIPLELEFALTEVILAITVELISAVSALEVAVDTLAQLKLLVSIHLTISPLPSDELLNESVVTELLTPLTSH